MNVWICVHASVCVSMEYGVWAVNSCEWVCVCVRARVCVCVCVCVCVTGIKVKVGSPFPHQTWPALQFPKYPLLLLLSTEGGGVYAELQNQNLRCNATNILAALWCLFISVSLDGHRCTHCVELGMEVLSASTQGWGSLERENFDGCAVEHNRTACPE